SRIAGVLALHGVGVVAASVHSDGRGTGLEQFRVERSHNRAVRWRAVIADLTRVLDGELDLGAAVDRRTRRYAPRRPSRAGPATRQDLIRWSEALAGIARTGLGFTQSLYEQERFQEVLAVAADIAHAAGGDFDPDHQVEEWLEQVGEGVPGYVTPKVGVAAVVGNEDNEILLVQRADSGIWLYPT